MENNAETVPDIQLSPVFKFMRGFYKENIKKILLLQFSYVGIFLLASGMIALIFNAQLYPSYNDPYFISFWLRLVLPFCIGIFVFVQYFISLSNLCFASLDGYSLTIKDHFPSFKVYLRLALVLLGYLCLLFLASILSAFIPVISFLFMPAIFSVFIKSRFMTPFFILDRNLNGKTASKLSNNDYR